MITKTTKTGKEQMPPRNTHEPRNTRKATKYTKEPTMVLRKTAKSLFRVFRGRAFRDHIRKMPNFACGIGALNADDRPSASACRVCAGSRIPSSHRRAVA